MCRKTTCTRCGKTTWAGCGQHVDSVMRGVASEDRCTCDHGAERERGGGGILSRLLKR